MYVQLTTRCDAECAHCAFSCLSTGIDMSDAVFDAAMALLERGDLVGGVTLGGGEPTNHPRFWDFVGRTLRATALYDAEASVHIITNGLNRLDAIALAKLARAGRLSASLSVSRYHPTPDADVITAFDSPDDNYWRHLDGRPIVWRSSGRSERDQRGLHSALREPIPIGRAAVMYPLGNSRTGECICSDVFVDVSGDLWACGCRSESYGTVFDPRLPSDMWDRDGTCANERRQEVLDEA